MDYLVCDTISSFVGRSLFETEFIIIFICDLFVSRDDPLMS